MSRRFALSVPSLNVGEQQQDSMSDAGAEAVGRGHRGRTGTHRRAGGRQTGGLRADRDGDLQMGDTAAGASR